MSKTSITAKMLSDGTVVEVLEDGSVRPLPRMAMREMTEDEIERAAYADPDSKPMTSDEMKTARRVPRIKTLRRALGLTQQEFATRYRIPIGTLRDWEQGRSEPDQPVRAYLTVIARDPLGVQRALQEYPGPTRTVALSVEADRPISMKNVENDESAKRDASEHAGTGAILQSRRMRREVHDPTLAMAKAKITQHASPSHRRWPAIQHAVFESNYDDRVAVKKIAASHISQGAALLPVTKLRSHDLKSRQPSH